MYTQTSKLNITESCKRIQFVFHRLPRNTHTLTHTDTQTDIQDYINHFSRHRSTGRRIQQKINGKVFRFGMGIVSESSWLHCCCVGHRSERCRPRRRTSQRAAAFPSSQRLAEDRAGLLALASLPQRQFGCTYCLVTGAGDWSLTSKWWM